MQCPRRYFAGLIYAVFLELVTNEKC
ncbi:protein of unknown function [Desulfovibrio sp. 86]|nr:protein of unknown function [Desulfovibrio sp. 86]